MIKGEKIYLRLTERRDLNIIMNMYEELSDGYVKFEQHKKYIYKNFEKISNSPLTCLSIVNNKNVVVGFLTYIDNGNNDFTMGITIGKRFRNRGYGKDSISAVINYLFHVCNIKSISLDVRRNNVNAIRCYIDCGFQFDMSNSSVAHMKCINSNYNCYERICS